MSNAILSANQFAAPTAPRTGDIEAPHARAIVNEYKPGQYYLRNLSVSPEHRGHGIGTQFMHDLLSEHDRAGTQVTLHAGRPQLMRWYNSLGFESEGEDALGIRMTRKPR